MCCCLKVMNKTSQITPQLSTASQIFDLTFVWRELIERLVRAHCTLFGWAGYLYCTMSCRA